MFQRAAWFLGEGQPLLPREMAPDALGVGPQLVHDDRRVGIALVQPGAVVLPEGGQLVQAQGGQVHARRRELRVLDPAKVRVRKPPVAGDRVDPAHPTERAQGDDHVHRAQSRAQDHEATLRPRQPLFPRLPGVARPGRMPGERVRARQRRRGLIASSQHHAVGFDAAPVRQPDDGIRPPPVRCPRPRRPCIRSAPAWYAARALEIDVARANAGSRRRPGGRCNRSRNSTSGTVSNSERVRSHCRKVLRVRRGRRTCCARRR